MLHASVSGNDHHERAIESNAHQLHAAHRGLTQRRVLDHRDVARELAQQAHRALHDIVEVNGVRQEERNGPALRLRKRGRGKVVDERPIALVRGDATGGGVRLGDETVVLERRHVVANRRRRHAEAVLFAASALEPTGSEVAT